MSDAMIADWTVKADSLYDSLILAAAKAENCDVVYSEDLNDGQIVDGVKIENPFK